MRHVINETHNNPNIASMLLSGTAFLINRPGDKVIAEVLYKKLTSEIDKFLKGKCVLRWLPTLFNQIENTYTNT